MTGVVWLANTAATRQHAVPDDSACTVDPFQVATLCRPASPLRLLPGDVVLGTPLPKCRACLNRLPACGAHLTPRTDPPPPGDDVVSPAARAGHLRYDDQGVKVQRYCDEPSTVEAAHG